MSQIPTNDSLLEDEPNPFEVGGASSPDDFQLKDPSTVAVTLHDDTTWKESLKFNVYVPLAVLAVGVIALIWFGTAEPEQKPNADNTRIGVLKSLPIAEVKTIQSVDEFLGSSNGPDGNPTVLHLKVDGSVVPYREAQIAAEVAGRIVEKSDQCEAGSYVKANEVLMRIDDTDYKLDVQRLTQEKRAAYQSLQEVDQQMANARELIKVAEADKKLRENDLTRQQELASKGFGSDAEKDAAERGVLQARQQLVTSQNTLNLLLKTRGRLEASEALAGTQLQLAEENLKRCEIRAPMDGVIVNEDAEINSFVTRGNRLVTIEDTSKVEVATNLRMDQLYWILDQERKRDDSDDSHGYVLPETAAIIEYKLSGREGTAYRWAGRLLGYDGIGLDSATRTVPVRVVVDNPTQFFAEDGTKKETMGPTALVRGMYVQISLLIRPQTPLYVIPAEAIRPGNRIWQFVKDDSVIDKIQKENSLATQFPVVDEQPKSEQDSDEDKNEQVSEGDRVCPICGTKMSTEDRDGIKIDRCDEHGFWLDKLDLAKPDEEFVEEEWEAGRVVVRGRVTPVDSLALELGTDPNEDSFAPGTKTTMWVCEIGGEVGDEDLMVVVSPLGSVEKGSTPARIAKEPKKELPAEQTVTSTPRSKEQNQ